jgi:hypothetical protein
MLFYLSGNMLFEKRVGPGQFQIVREGQEEVMKVNCFGSAFPPSIEDSKLCMATMVENLLKVPSVNRIILSERRNYEYDEKQVNMLSKSPIIYLNSTKTP